MWSVVWWVRVLGVAGFKVYGFGWFGRAKTTRNGTWVSTCPFASLQHCSKKAQKLQIGQNEVINEEGSRAHSIKGMDKKTQNIAGSEPLGRVSCTCGVPLEQ